MWTSVASTKLHSTEATLVFYIDYFQTAAYCLCPILTAVIVEFVEL